MIFGHYFSKMKINSRIKINYMVKWENGIIYW